jgi:hypothetical protein
MKTLQRLAAIALLTLVSSVGAAPPEQGEAEPPSGNSTELAERLERAEILAGLTEVVGPGLIIVLRHSPRMVQGVDPATLQIHEQDVAGVLNALRIAGAEALAITDTRGTPMERIVGTTAIAGIEDGVLVNGTPLVPPYRIFALGDASLMRTELYREEGVVKKAGLDSLQMIQLDSAATLIFPPCKARTPFKHARSRPGTLVAQAGPVTNGTRPADTTPKKQPVVAVIPKTQPTGVTEGMPRAPQPAVASTVSDMGSGKNRIPGSPGSPRPGAPAVGGSEKPAGSEVLVVLFGGKDLAKYHVTGCRFGERLEKPKRVTFASAEAARQAGRTACKICVPDPMTR